jgi:hypothetical protein
MRFTRTVDTLHRTVRTHVAVAALGGRRVTQTIGSTSPGGVKSRHVEPQEMTMRTFIANARFPLVVAALLLSAACDNPVAPEDHADAGGVVILDAGTGAVLAQSVGALADFSQPLNLTLGQALEVEILFLDASDPTDLDRAFHPHEEDGESLRVTITNEAIVEYHAHGDHGDFEPMAAGQTTARIELWHGNHADFRSGLLTIIVQ